MMWIGAFSPLRGFIGKADWKGVCESMRMADGTFWPIPITLSTDEEMAARHLARTYGCLAGRGIQDKRGEKR